MQKLFYFFIILSVIFTACQGDSTQMDEQKDVSSGNELLLDNDLGEAALFPTTPEIESETIDRAFENSPPLIPHTTQGMMVITREHNECMLCHMPNKAEEKGATPMPETHFTKFRPEIVTQNKLYVVQAKENEVIQKSLEGGLSHAMYNCNQCHVPQANISVDIENLFTPDFRSHGTSGRSNLTKNIGEGVK